ncbi:MAG TPA: hypothetical protein VH482_36205 [Thermomicrobiales bacterium]
MARQQATRSAARAGFAVDLGLKGGFVAAIETLNEGHKGAALLRSGRSGGGRHTIKRAV